jgi:hypothetical protein
VTNGEGSAEAELEQEKDAAADVTAEMEKIQLGDKESEAIAVDTQS